MDAANPFRRNARSVSTSQFMPGKERTAIVDILPLTLALSLWEREMFSYFHHFFFLPFSDCIDEPVHCIQLFLEFALQSTFHIFFLFHFCSIVRFLSGLPNGDARVL